MPVNFEVRVLYKRKQKYEFSDREKKKITGRTIRYGIYLARMVFVVIDWIVFCNC